MHPQQERFDALSGRRKDEFKHFLEPRDFERLQVGDVTPREAVVPIKEEYDLALTKKNDPRAFREHWKSANREEDWTIPFKVKILTDYNRLRYRVCVHINQHRLHGMRPIEPPFKIPGESDRSPFKKKIWIFDLLDERKLRSRFAVTTEDQVVREAERLCGAKDYSFERSDSRYPERLKDDIGNELGISVTTVHRYLVRADWDLPSQND